MVNFQYMWILSRNPYETGATDYEAFKTKVLDLVVKTLPWYDPYNGSTEIIFSRHTYSGNGCKYLPLPTGQTIINPNDPNQVLPPGTVTSSGMTVDTTLL